MMVMTLTIMMMAVMIMTMTVMMMLKDAMLADHDYFGEEGGLFLSVLALNKLY